jgi:hypothetical protein
MARSYGYNPRTLSYIEHTNAGARRLSPQTVSQDVTRVAIASRNQMRGLAIKLKNGELALQQFYDEMSRSMKQSYYAAVSAARGRQPNELLRDAEIAFVVWLFTRQFDHLNDFMDDIESGKVKLDGGFVNRAGMYGMATKSVFENWKLWEAGQNGYQECRRILGPSEHCYDGPDRPGCIELAQMGWMPIQQMTPIGDATCLTNCQCHLEFRNQRQLSARSPFDGLYQFEQQHRSEYIDIRDSEGHLLFKYNPTSRRVEIKHKYMGAPRIVDMNTLRVETRHE